MRHRIAVAAIAAAALVAAACQDSEGGAHQFITAPGSSAPDAAERYVTMSRSSVVDRTTHRLVPVERLLGGQPGVSASIVNGSGTIPTMQVTSDEPGVARSGGYGIQKFTDGGNHVHAIVMLYRSTGGPPAAIQHYVDGALESTSAYTWQKTTSGWVRTGSLFRQLNNGALVGTYSTQTSVAPPGGGGGPVQTVRLDHPARGGRLERVTKATVYGLALALATQSAQAQMYFSACQQEWLHYLAAAAVLAGAAAGVAYAPLVSPALITGFIAALATAAGFESLLIDCMLTHSPVFLNSMPGGGGGAPQSKSECLDGGYAGCTISTVK